MKSFSFVGKLQASKSIMNRLLLVQDYAPGVRIQGQSDCEDVRLMREGLQQLHGGQPVEVGHAGTVLRFLAMRAARLKGRYLLRGEPRLFARPHEELIQILRQVGAQAHFSAQSLEIESNGWKMHGDTLLIPGERSSQFASAVLLNAWDLPFDLYVSVSGHRVSIGYWRMSVEIAQRFGLKIDFWDADFRVSKEQTPIGMEWPVEMDMSSAFALAGVAAVSGHATFLNFPAESLQPDAQFVSILERMGVPITRSTNSFSLRVEKASRLNGVVVNLRSAPDLFPVLAILCAVSEGESDLFGAPHLAYKESNRLQRVTEWIRNMGREVIVGSEGLRIRGPVVRAHEQAPMVLDCDQDHRLAFAAAVVRAAGFTVDIKNAEVVAKSFPDFWRIVDGSSRLNY